MFRVLYTDRFRRMAAAVFAIVILAATTSSAVSATPAAGLTAPAAAAAAPEVSAESSILTEACSGTVLFEKNADSKMLIASTTKILTALVVLERCGMDDPVRIGDDFPVIEGSSMYLKPGETLKVGDLLYGLMLASGNDAAVALALHTAGSIEAFSKLMNDRAAQLGCTQSHFVNPHGLDADGQYSTARDLALIAGEAMNHATFRQIVSTKFITVAGRTLKNHNKLLWSCPGTLGVKTGYTERAGRTLVSCAERNGMRLICVTLRASGDWQDHSSLYQWAFNEYRSVRVTPESLPADTIPVVSGTKTAAAVRTAESYALVYRASENVALSWELRKFAYAPVSAGAAAGSAVITKDGKVIKTIPLVFDETVDLDGSVPLNLFEKMKRQIFGSN